MARAGWRTPFWARSRWTLARLRGRRGEESPVDRQGVDWFVRPVAGGRVEGKTYRCPGCDQTIPSGVAHLVAWSGNSAVEERRHWHKACWNARDRRSALVH
ncbi:ATP/GTP-binding protein [Streptomyces sp. NBC_00637]|uniref:ATP/GTP-binding protein n=1 Tax=Streptomyces sp. NBC_00637 TaxID=2903667 RepID=UPI00325473CE